MNRINIFTGHFGSGKTELALNYAIKVRKKYNNVAIVDLDIVNPYFRTRDAEYVLNSNDIKLISSKYANSNIDVPALPPEVISLFQDESCQTILDVGGDDDGAVVLGRYNKFLKKFGYNMFFVINTKRPMTRTKDDIIKYISDIERASRLKATALINNTNLSEKTTISDLLKGQQIIQAVSDQINIPVKYISGKNEIISQIGKEYEDFLMPIERFLKSPWEL